MKLIEALEILRKEPPEPSDAFRAFLASGFEPLHLQTFLTAQLRLAFPGRKTQILSGVYGDFWGNLDRLSALGADVGILFCEWSDLDPRLSLRSLGSWEPSTFPEVLSNVRARASHLVEVAEKLSRQTTVVISLPTLPLPPVSFTPGWHAGALDLELKAIASSAGAKLALLANVKVLNSERLDRASPPGARLDAKSELAFGFPYQLTHASVLAEMMSHLVSAPTPKKGLITDLDDTLWSGVLGEEGFDGVFWDLEHHSQSHGLYQRLLDALSETGVLLAAASKNDPQLVAKVLDRNDLILSRQAIFPVEAHWRPKSESVSRILKTWNIGADSVVFIDDSPMELAEVKATHPDIECILFPKDDPQALLELLHQLRDLFGKGVLSQEDGIRRESIRRFQENVREFEGRDGKLEDFLAQAKAELTLNFSKEPLDPRALELVNKTNQFNLNGRRYTESAWQSYVKQPDTFLLIAAYKDKYGPLGKIAVLAGQTRAKKILLDVWVMSCRAFSRRIEYQCVAELFKHFQVSHIAFNFQATTKNGPLREFLAQLLGMEPRAGCELSKDEFAAIQEKTFQGVVEVPNG